MNLSRPYIGRCGLFAALVGLCWLFSGAPRDHYIPPFLILLTLTLSLLGSFLVKDTPQ